MTFHAAGFWQRATPDAPSLFCEWRRYTCWLLLNFAHSPFHFICIILDSVTPKIIINCCCVGATLSLCFDGESKWTALFVCVWGRERPQLSAMTNCILYLRSAICDVGLYYSRASVWITNLHLQFHARQPKHQLHELEQHLQQPLRQKRHKQKRAPSPMTTTNTATTVRSGTVAIVAVARWKTRNQNESWCTNTLYSLQSCSLSFPSRLHWCCCIHQVYARLESTQLCSCCMIRHSFVRVCVFFFSLAIRPLFACLSFRVFRVHHAVHLFCSYRV